MTFDLARLRLPSDALHEAEKEKWGNMVNRCATNAAQASRPRARCLAIPLSARGHVWISDLARVWPGVAARSRACGCWGAALFLLLLAPSSCAGLTLPDPRKGSAECGQAGLSHVCDPGQYLGAAAAKSVDALAAQLESSGSIVTAAVVQSLPGAAADGKGSKKWKCSPAGKATAANLRSAWGVDGVVLLAFLSACMHARM